MNTSQADSYEQQIEELQGQVTLYRRRLEAAHRISIAIGSGSSLDELLKQTLHTALNTVDADAGSLLLYDAQRSKLVFQYVVGDARLIGLEIDPETDRDGRAATVFRTAKPLITNTQKESYNSKFDSTTGYHTESILTAPLKSPDGSVIGVMQALNSRNGEFHEEDSSLLETVCGIAAVAIVNARLAQEAQLAAIAHALGDLSHDIKNALTPIDTLMETTVEAFIEPMYEDLDKVEANLRASNTEAAAALHDAVQPLRDWYPEARSAVQDGCADIREMVAEIADYIKGTQSTHMEVQDIGKVLEDRLRRLRVLAQNRRVTLSLEGLENVPAFEFDSRLIGRAVFNLINNALGAISDAVRRKKLEMRPFHIQVSVRVQNEGVFPQGGYCQITVQDDGPGIPPRVLESLFTPRAISTTPGGTGIGTRFVKSVADAHHGVVGVESVEGDGAAFWLKLPLVQPS